VRPVPDVEDLRLWSVVSATVRPLKPSHAIPAVAPVEAESLAPKTARQARQASEKKAHPAKARIAAPQPPQDVEANLRHRLARGREALAARIDLHGLNHDRARAALTRFIERSVADGWRAVLVITGKGAGGDGVLRRRVPDWLAEPPIRQHIAGVSEAHRRHGGEGALYVALKRRT